MISKFGHDDELALAFFTKETSFDAGVTINDTNACSLKNFEGTVTWEDTVVDDKAEVSGSEYGTDQEVIEKSMAMTVNIPKAKPNDIAGLAALVLGAITSTQDGATTAYSHKITPVAHGTALPSTQGEHKRGGVQHAYKGVKGQSLTISGEEGGLLSVSADLVGSGTRATSATAFPSKVSENWLKMADCDVWMESGADITITATLVQSAEDISSATPVDLKGRMKSFTITVNNNADRQIGFGGSGVAQDIDKGRRTVEGSFAMRFNDATEMDHFDAQDALALELDLASSLLVDAAGTVYYGVQIIIPRCMLKKAPLPEGGASDALTASYELDIQDDGTNAVIIVETYTAKAAYLA